jgi:hypothetical protein
VSESEQPSEAAKRLQRTAQRHREYIWLAQDGDYLGTNSIMVARRKLYTRLLADLKLLVDRRATAIIESVVTGVVLPDPKELTRAVSTATQEMQKFFDVMSKAFDDVKEDAKKYITYGHPSYTGFYDRDVKPIKFSEFMELMCHDDYRRVGLTKLATPDGTEISVSTVWFGADHAGTKGAPPLIYESLISGGHGDGRTDRYTTLQEAQKGHSDLLDWVRQMDGAT